VSRGPLVLVLTVGIVAISTAAVMIKLCADAAPAVIAAARLGIATIVLVPGALLIRGRRGLRTPPGSRRYLILAGAFLAAHFYFWITSLKHTSVMSSVVIVTTNPIFIGVASYFLFGERIRRHLIVGIIVAAAGGVLMALADAQKAAGTLYGDLLSLLGAIMASGYLLVGRKVRRDVHVLAYITPVYAVAAVVLLGVMLAMRAPVIGLRSETYVYFILLALVPQLLGHGSLNWALRYTTATMVAIVILGEPVTSTIFAYFVLGETVAPLQLLGGALILAGIFIALQSPPARPAAVQISR
jgi:drug/metabolite transporter (DMT)-like permease